MLLKLKSIIQNYLLHITFSLIVLFLFSCDQRSKSVNNNSEEESEQILRAKTLSFMDTMVIFDPETYTESVEVKKHDYKLLAVVDTLYRLTDAAKETMTITEIYASPELKLEDLKRIKTKVWDTLYIFDTVSKMEIITIRKYQTSISKQ